MNPRYLQRFIAKDLARKMVFVAGPRQVGKTTLALNILGASEKSEAYFNFDRVADRKRLFAELFPSSELIVLDEIHKFRSWRNWLKGLYDKTKSERRYLVTGSARLDYYRRGGDSLLGRYHFYRLHPLSVAELKSQRGFALDRLLDLGGFPEPYFLESTAEAKRWRKERRTLVIREDLRDLERVADITQLELMAERLPELVGSPLSINNLAGDLQVNFRTAANWLSILERLYYCYRVYPFGSDRIRAVKKESKLYLWDWSEVSNPGARFENLVAGHLLKYCHFVEDTEGSTMELRYLRDALGREVDFVVVRDRKPLFAVECKLTESGVPPSLRYFADRVRIPKFILLHTGSKEYESPDRRIVTRNAVNFLKTLV